MTPKRFFSVFAIGEAITWALLLVGMFLKYGLKLTDVMVTIGGGLHGFMFLAFIGATIFVGVSQKWTATRTTLGILSSVLPFATIPFESWCLKSGVLDGDWRLLREEPRSWIEKLVAVCLRRPVLALAVALIAVAAVFSALLVIGPPGK